MRQAGNQERSAFDADMAADRPVSQSMDIDCLQVDVFLAKVFWSPEWASGTAFPRRPLKRRWSAGGLAFVCGEVMDAVHVARRGKIDTTEAGWAMQRALLGHLETVWQQPGAGMWDVRGRRQNFTYSKVPDQGRHAGQAARRAGDRRLTSH